ncbi:hypothetical protein CFG14_21570 [Salmonella enterica]|nr:hypothetical protein [Salmonella enterica]EDR7079647.1 hypothetical protein [Salmonella enterica subsp. enterica serovar Gatuni]EDT0686888.1 hypothetical protein [Salmonella enterica subsp. enterica serovar Kokomlemle]EDU5440764.1 hypothetical protein [Salmonella enterica subsp. enterica serovar Hadar]EEE1373439.1 hypothetical protein [Salmonella enterica subsp. enterica serovar Durban]
MIRIKSCFMYVLLSSLVNCTVAIADTPGDIPGNSGSVNVHVSLRQNSLSTCKFSVERTNQSFDTSGAHSKAVTLPNSFTINNCGDASLDFQVIFSNPIREDGWWGPAGYAGRLCHGDGDCTSAHTPTNAIAYYVVIPPNTPGVSGKIMSGRVPDSLITGEHMTIEPDSDNYTFNANTQIPPVSILNGMESHIGHVHGSYTYIFSFP